MKRWIIGILLGGLLLSGCDRVTYVNIPTQTTDSTTAPASTVSGPTTKPTETKAPTLPTVTSKPTTAPSEPDPDGAACYPAPGNRAPGHGACTDNSPYHGSHRAGPYHGTDNGPHGAGHPPPNPLRPLPSLRTRPERTHCSMHWSMGWMAAGSAAGLPALTLDDTLCSEAAMAIQHYLSTGASPVGCTVVALDPALTDGEMVDLFLTLCGDETILSEAYTRYGVALTSDNGVYYAAGFFA